MNLLTKIFSLEKKDEIKAEPELLKTAEHDVDQLLEWIRGCLTQGRGLIAQSELDHLSNIQLKIRLLIEDYADYFDDEIEENSLLYE